MKRTLTTLALASLALTAGSVQAATVVNVGDGETVCESLKPSVFTAADCDHGGNADLANSSNTSDALTFLGSGALLGYVKDAAGDSSKYPDYASLTLAKDSYLTLTLVEPQSGFDALFTLGNGISEAIAWNDGPLTVFATAGTYLLGIDATKPTNSLTAVSSSYRLDVNVAAVPAPAGALLLLTGAGALGALRRKKTG